MTKLRIALVSFLVLLGIVAADVNFNESRATLKAVASASLSNATLSNPTFTGTVTASQVTGIPIVLAKWGVPCILASSGTMGDNGAVSGMTALPTTYSGGAWLYLPANSINGSNAAGFYWFVASGTQAGTVYNSTWNGAGIPPAGTTTAFVSTGPGAFTGISSGEITCATVTIPAGAMGPNGHVHVDYSLSHNTAAGNKIFRIDFGGTDILSQTTSTTGFFWGVADVFNLGAAGRQAAAAFINAGGSSAANSTFPTVDTSAAVSLTFTLEKATATNHAIWNGVDVQIVYGS